MMVEGGGSEPAARGHSIMPTTPRHADQLVSLKVTLRGIRPPIWRRLVVPGAMTLGHLHQAIQAAMGWDDEHLHMFDIAGRSYGDPSAVDDVADEEHLTLNGILKSDVARFTYTYDFGDNWEHTIVIEGQPPPVDSRRYPTCVAGKRNCPPEDCGGAWGYQDLLAVLADPAHPRYREWIEMIGEGFDPEDFSVDAADARVAARFGQK
jgi:Plasmid pRiA4b ORF-3-like protein